MFPIRTILYPTDFSDRAAFAFQAACSLARDYGARLLVLHVERPPVAALGGAQAVPPLPEEYGRQQLEERLRRVRPADPTLAVDHRVRLGEPAAEILRVAQESGCDLIVMGTHGRTALGRLLMGSVAEQVLRKAPCPVLTVRGPLHAPALESLPLVEEPLPVG